MICDVVFFETVELDGKAYAFSLNGQLPSGPSEGMTIRLNNESEVVIIDVLYDVLSNRYECDGGHHQTDHTSIDDLLKEYEGWTLANIETIV